MNLLTLLTRLEELDINIEVEDGQLNINAPEGKLTPDLIDKLKQNKSEIIKFFQENLQNKIKYKTINPVEKKAYYELSSSQQRLYILQQMEQTGTAYNITNIIPLRDEFHIEKLEYAFKKLIAKHESLRTSFEMIAEKPVQRIHGRVEFKIEYDARVNSTPSGFIKDFVRVFDLAKAPLLRVGLAVLQPTPSAPRSQPSREGRSILIVDMHHIISDGTSHSILASQFTTLYAGESLPAQKLQYKDYSEWRALPQQKESIKRQEQYWENQFSDLPPVLNLPTDYPRPLEKSFTGNILYFEFSPEETKALNQMARLANATLFMVLLALYNILLAKLSNREDIVIGIPTSGRIHLDIEQVIGIFVNTLALRNYPSGQKTFKTFLKEISKKTIAAFENQDYQFEDLVEKLAVQRDVSRNPLFDTMFVLQNINTVEIETPGIQLYPHEQERELAKFDLALVAVETGDKLVFNFEYSTALFSKATIKRFISYYKRVTAAVIKNPGKKTADIEIITEQEKKSILYELNDTRTVYPQDKTIHQFFEEQVNKLADQMAIAGSYVFAGAIREAPIQRWPLQITYKEMNERANRLTYELREKGADPGAIVGIMAERSVETIIGILGILKSGGAYLPIAPEYPEERINYILKDSNAKILLTEGEIANLTLPQAFNNCPKGTPFHPHLPAPAASLAYIIYTSGSTGNPKGVLVGHHNVLRLVKNSNYIHFSPGDRLLLTGTMVFDITTFEIWAPLLNGIRLSLESKDVFLSAEKLKEVLVKQNISILHLIPQLFNQLAASDLELFAGLKYFLVGGDLVQPKYINKLRQRYSHLKILHMYGPTENTTFSTFFLVQRDYEHNIPIGRPISNSTVYISDKYHHLQPVGVMGELWVGGEGTARGYLNRPELTAEKFINCRQTYFYRSYMSHMPYLYRTGDMACLLPDGNIKFLGRLDHQVKIRGFRIELGEIESRLMQHPVIKEAVVLDKTDENGDKYLCAYMVMRKEEIPGADKTPTDLLEIKNKLAKDLPHYMIPSYFMELEKIPLTANGKVDQRAMPEPKPGEKEDGIAPRNEIERKLAAAWAEVLNINKELIGIHANFFELGGHSLKATLLTSRIHKELHVKIPLAEIFKSQTIAALSEYIKGINRDKYESIEPVEKKDYYAMSSAQKRLYILQQMDLDNTAYNMPEIIPLGAESDPTSIENTIKKLIKRHESFRTSFHMINDDPVQKIHEEVDFEIEDLDFKVTGHEIKIGEVMENFIRPFALSVLPLWRVGLIKAPKNQPILIIDMHHIICDGISHAVLKKDFMRLYNGEEPEPLRIQYKDYPGWQETPAVKKLIKKQEKYWLQEFAGEIPLLNLPTDFLRPGVQSFEGNTLDFEITGKNTRALNEIARAEGATLFIVLLAIFYVFLFNLTNQEDIVVGTPCAGRKHSDLEHIIGMFVNTLPLRNYPIGMKRFIDFLREVKEKTLLAFENQDYQFEDIVERVVIGKDMSRNPLFDIMFTLQNSLQVPGVTSQEQMEELKIQPYAYKSKTTKFDLDLTAVEAGGKLFFSFAYCTKLFKEETIVKFITYFKKIIDSVVESFELKISEIEIIPGEEKNRFLFDFNNTRTAYPKEKTIQQLFEAQVEKAPGKVALAEGNHYKYTSAWDQEEGTRETVQLTYRELNERSNQLAQLLAAKGIESEGIVGIMTHRSLELISGLLAILKVGAAYLPIDYRLPQERIMYMLGDSHANILLTQKDLLGKFENINFKGNIIDIGSEECYAGNRNKLKNTAVPDSPSYIIYTSGSTGKPKGVVVEHRNVIRLVKNSNFIDFKKDDKLLLTGSIAFDVTTFEIWNPMLNGFLLFLVKQEIILDGEKLGETLVKNSITILHFIPQLFNQLADQNPGIFSGLRYLLVGGDIVRPHYINKVRNRYQNLQVLHMYGPTENTTFSTFLPVDKNYEITIPIGKPISNSTAYIFNKYDKLKPWGTIGELGVGGKGIARGYLNNPELTMEKFIENPFIPGEKMYRTGDLARWLSDGKIEFLGREDEQVKIRGIRIELGEIESQLANHEEIKEVLVIDREDEKGDKYLCAYFVPNDTGTKKKTLNNTILREFLAVNLPDYMIPSYFIHLKKIPLTANGKIDRKALPEPKIEAREEYAAPRDHLEEMLVGLWAEILGLERKVISIDANFFELGGHSLRATKLAAKIHKAYNVKTPFVEIFKEPTIRSLARYIRDAEEDKYISIKPEEKKEYYTLSSAQKRLWILDQLDEKHIAYNLPIPHLVEGDLNIDVLKNSYETVVRRHESLRTVFVMVGEEPRQKIHDPETSEFKLECIDLTNQEDGEKQVEILVSEEAETPFDLERGPILRIKLIHRNEKQYVLLFNIHHIASDEWSMRLLVNEVLTLYDTYKKGNENPLAPLPLQYKDYSVWQTGEKMQEALKRQEEYWVKEFAGEIPQLWLPNDYPRPAIQSFSGNAIGFELNGEETKALKKITRAEGATLFMVLLALFNVFLSKLSNQEDIVVGTPIAGRRHADLGKIIGMFVNTLAIRNQPSGNKRFADFLQQVKERTIKQFENQDYPFEDLVDKVVVNRDMSRNPLFDVMFVLQDILEASAEIPGEKMEDLNVKSYAHVNRSSKFDLTLTAAEAGEKLFLSFEYYTELFKEETILRFISYFKQITASLIECPGKKIAEIAVISEEETKRILYEFNDTGIPYPTDKTIHVLFEDQVKRTPDNIAIIGPPLEVKYLLPEDVEGNASFRYHIQLTYNELNKKSDQLALLLGEKGVAPDIIAGIMVGHSLEMIVGILGILKAGGAYLPIDADYPEDRIDYMLKDSGAEIVLKDNDFTPEVFNNYPKGTPSFRISPRQGGQLAYIIYTSGTTGWPKGVAVEHKSANNTLLCRKEQYRLNPSNTALQLFSSSFDGFITSFFTPVISGTKIVLLKEEERKDIDKIKTAIVRYRVSTFISVPVLYGYIIDALSGAGAASLQIVILAGDKVPANLLTITRQKNPNLEIAIEYGVTESAVMSTLYRHQQKDDEIKIGKPIWNTRIYILNNRMALNPIGVAGEMYIAGAGIARGYLNNPKLTAEKFDHDLWNYPDYQDKKVTGKDHMQSGNHASRQYHSPTPQYPIAPSPHFPIYRTGDLARWLPDGNIEFFGRIDYQVKIRGFRIELEEIESQLLKHDEIKKAVVTLREKDRGSTSNKKSGDTYLCAYFVSDKELEISQLKNYLSAKLPAYMIPSQFMKIDEIPLSPTGKIDTRALRSLGENMTPEVEYVEPGNELEKTIARIWQELLKLDRVGTHDNFFDLGGNSLDIVSLRTKVKTEIGKYIPLVEFFRYPTIHSFSIYLEKGETPVTSTQKEKIEESVTLMEETMQLLMGD